MIFLMEITKCIAWVQILIYYFIDKFSKYGQFCHKYIFNTRKKNLTFVINHYRHEQMLFSWKKLDFTLMTQHFKFKYH